MAAELAVISTTVRTMDPARPIADAIACTDGVIVAIGGDDVRRACDATTQVIDGSGGTLTPGLVDGHQHLFMAAERRRGVDLSGARGLDEVRARLRAGREQAGPGAWLLGYGAEYASFPGAQFHYQALDGAEGPGPMLIWTFDMHSALVNAQALRIAGVTGPVRFADSGEVVCDDNGQPTGELHEWSAMDLVGEHIPAPTPQQRRSWYVEALRAQNAVGLTGQHLMDGGPHTTGLLAAMEADGQLTQRVKLHHFIYPTTSDDEFDEIIASKDRQGRFWRADGAKFMMDGIIDTGTAWLEEPDVHGDSTGPMWPQPEAYARRVQQLHRAGFKIATHAIGDRAVRNVLDTYAALPGGSLGRHRIEHIETAPDSTITRFAPEMVTASMQPIAMQWVEPDRSDPWSARLDAQRCDHGWRVGDLSAGGALVVLGSDWPVGHFDPRLGFFAARMRRGPDAADPRPIGATRPLTGEETLAGYTVNAAKATGDSQRAGQLRPGFDADFVLWGADPVTCPADSLTELPVLLTVTGGQIVHRA
ncbi:MAG TPA: amidohydrolase [Streptosporangiaceae bacterium]|nr:amidohydrolase [Streptosporangiaceae bacterium]